MVADGNSRILSIEGHSNTERADVSSVGVKTTADCGSSRVVGLTSSTGSSSEERKSVK